MLISDAVMALINELTSPLRLSALLMQIDWLIAVLCMLFVLRNAAGEAPYKISRISLFPWSVGSNFDND